MSSLPTVVCENGGLGMKPGKRVRHQVDFNAVDFALLEAAAIRFGRTRSEVAGSLVRAAIEIGPALSAENAEVLASLSGEVNGATRVLGQIVRVLNSRKTIGKTEVEAVWGEVFATVAALDRVLTEMLSGYGATLRLAARLEEGGVVEAGSVRGSRPAGRGSRPAARRSEAGVLVVPGLSDGAKSGRLGGRGASTGLTKGGATAGGSDAMMSVADVSASALAGSES